MHHWGGTENRPKGHMLTGGLFFLDNFKLWLLLEVNIHFHSSSLQIMTKVAGYSRPTSIHLGFGDDYGSIGIRCCVF